MKTTFDLAREYKVWVDKYRQAPQDPEIFDITIGDTKFNFLSVSVFFDGRYTIKRYTLQSDDPIMYRNGDILYPLLDIFLKFTKTKCTFMEQYAGVRSGLS